MYDDREDSEYVHIEERAHSRLSERYCRVLYCRYHSQNGLNIVRWCKEDPKEPSIYQTVKDVVSKGEATSAEQSATGEKSST